MCRTTIKDLDFCETEPFRGAQVRGSIYRRATWTWGSSFDGGFDAGDFGFSTGFAQLYGFALGAIKLSNGNSNGSNTTNSRWTSQLGNKP